MTNFEDLKSQWENQPEINIPNNGSKRIIEKVAFVKKKQQITNIVLGITTLVLVSFFFYIKAYKNILLATALMLMIGSLLTRIAIEYFSTKALKNINISLNASAFKEKIIDYYQKRIKIHHIFTPIIAALYIVGFIMLLPFFKEELSAGFYTYIKVSGVIIFIILTLFIRKEILKELKTIKQLSS